MDPSEKVCGVFRRRNGGKTEMSTNSHSATSNFFVDRSRLGTHDEYDPDVKNDWGGMGKFVPKPNDIRLNAVSAMGDLRAKSSYRSVDALTNDTGTGPCCIPPSCPPNGMNPMYRKRNGE